MFWCVHNSKPVSGISIQMLLISYADCPFGKTIYVGAVLVSGTYLVNTTVSRPSTHSWQLCVGQCTPDLFVGAGWLLSKVGIGRHLPWGVQLGGDALTAHPRVDPATGHIRCPWRIFCSSVLAFDTPSLACLFRMSSKPTLENTQ